MPTNYSSRLTITGLVLLCCIFGIPGLGDGILKTGSLFKSVPWSEKLNLKPGIDIAGGTSLVYQIKESDNPAQAKRSAGASGMTRAELMVQALKKRVDPNGLLNLIWRPQGEDRLEIQIPQSTHAGDRGKAQKDYAVARDLLRATNVTVDDVSSAIRDLSGTQRDQKLNELADGSVSRQKLFRSLAKLHDDIAQYKSALATAKTQDQKDEFAQKAAEAEIQQEKLQRQITDGNLSEDDLQLILNMPQDEQAKRIDALLTKYADFPARVAAIKQYQSSFAEIEKAKNSLDDAADLKRLLRGSGVLEFHILVDDLQTAEAQAMIQRLKTEGPASRAGDSMRWYLVDNEEQFGKGHPTFSMDGDPGHKYALAWAVPGKQLIHNVPGQKDWTLSDAGPEKDSRNGDNIVRFDFDPIGARYFGELTRNNINRPLAIVLDNKMISAPNINSEITSEGTITGGNGGFSGSEQAYLADTLKAGSLPASLGDDPVSERTVSANLGNGNLKKGLAATGIGVIVVGVFLIGYYYLAGVVAFIAVLMNLIIILGVLAMLGATFTMPSIAGIVLTIGTAVDANVLVFERMREEEHRGFPLKLALQHAYDRALSAIVDSNMTTIITSLFLYFFGSEEVRGFGLTLVIGITSSLFTALFVTKTIFAILINERGVKELGSIPTSFPKWDKLLKPDIDWMGMIWPFVAFSAVFIIAGMSAFIIHKRDMFDIEFASGTSVQFELNHDMTQQKVVDTLAKRKEIPSASVVSLNNRKDLYEVVTPNDNAAQVSDAVLDALGPNLKTELPSKFDFSQKGKEINVDSVIGKAVVPIEKRTLTIDGKNIPDAASYTGGVAIVLRNLSPPIHATEISSRMDRESTAPGSSINLSKFKMAVLPMVHGEFVAKHNAEDPPVTEAVILVQQPDFLYSKGEDAWSKNVADPIWRLTNEGVGREAKLQKVSNFDPQVAGDTQRQAFLATFLSILAIMVYIWFRFGDMKYATATVVALIHDTLAVVGAVGLSHYLDNGLGHAFLVEPFRINLTLVAAILTIMGYSMIDTIVVFDRIRENRGRYGSLTRKVINDSINQTLSRTLLTAGTTLITVTTMYLLGGPAIHGFTFVLLVGILIGTYSSIAIASPILLIGGDKMAVPAKVGTGPASPLGQGRRADPQLSPR